MGSFAIRDPRLELGGIAKRCSGRKQYCYTSYPFSKSTGDEPPTEAYCEDKSDQVFAVNSRCNNLEYVNKWCSSICASIPFVDLPDSCFLSNSSSYNCSCLNISYMYWRNPEDTALQSDFIWCQLNPNFDDCNDKCANVTDWSLRNTDVDMHGCQDSCLTRGYNCSACTHPDFKFQCEVNGTSKCLHPDLVCDGHAMCDNAEDEELTSECIE